METLRQLQPATREFIRDEPQRRLNVISCRGPDPNGVPQSPDTTRRQDRKSLKLRQQPIEPRASTARGFFLSCAAFVLLLCRKVIRVVPDLIPRSREHLCFDCLASSPHYAGHRSLMDSSLDVRIAKKQIGPDVEAAIGDTSCGRCDPWFPAKIAALGT